MLVIPHLIPVILIFFFQFSFTLLILLFSTHASYFAFVAIMSRPLNDLLFLTVMDIPYGIQMSQDSKFTFRDEGSYIMLSFCVWMTVQDNCLAPSIYLPTDFIMFFLKVLNNILLCKCTLFSLFISW